MNLLNPLWLWRIWRLEHSRRSIPTAADDAQLRFYSEFLPGGFLHYGYFEDPSVKAEDISLSQMQQAQRDYAEKILDQLRPVTRPVLDAGCGMGGLLPMLEARGFKPVALTPDRTQAGYIRRTYPDIPLIHAKLESIGDQEPEQAYGAVITSESFQYMNLGASIALIDRVLEPGGRWVLCDYFRTNIGSSGSGHRLDDFMDEIKKSGLRPVYQEDITINILPTLLFADLLVERLARPALELADYKLSTKHPGVYYALLAVISRFFRRLDESLRSIDPALFKQNKQYMLMTLEKQ